MSVTATLKASMIVMIAPRLAMPLVARHLVVPRQQSVTMLNTLHVNARLPLVMNVARASQKIRFR